MELKTARLTVLVDPAKKKAFEALCARQDVTPSQVVRRLIRDYLVHHGVISSGRLTLSQGDEIGRPSTLEVDVEPDGDASAIHVGGGVRIIGSGAFDLPD